MSFRMLSFFGTITLVLWGITQLATWYGNEVLIQRMCERKAAVLNDFQEVLSLSTQAGEQLSNRRALMIASKLIFLVPQHNDESKMNYQYRVSQYLNHQCAR